jgi:hypothetical protein
LLYNWLPTKDNIVRREMLYLSSLLCVGYCGISKTSNHLFLGCDYSSVLWCKVLSKFNISCSLLIVILGLALPF